VVPFGEAAKAFLNWADSEYREHPNSANRLHTSFASLVPFFGKLPVNDLGRLIVNQGCRPEEFLKLRKDAVDLERGTFRIVSGKSIAARRTLTMTAETGEILTRRMAGISPWIVASPKTNSHVLNITS
jgi:integrase